MQTNARDIWWLRIATFFVAALAAASATYWVLKWMALAPSNQSAALVMSSPIQADPQMVARLLGGGLTGVATVPAPPHDAAASRFKLSGVVTDRARGGYALISVDGKPARPYRVGARVNDALVVHSVSARSVALAARLDAPVVVTLDLPKLAQP